MKISKHGWNHTVTRALRPLPEELRAQLSIDTDHVGPMKCASCGLSWYVFVGHQPICSRCARTPGPAVDLVDSRSRMTIRCGEEVLLSALLILVPRRPGRPPARSRSSEIVVLGPTWDCFRQFRLESAKVENSEERLQQCARGLVYPAIGLTVDREGQWGWPGGLRLDGGAMVPTMDEVIDRLEATMPLSEGGGRNGDSNPGEQQGDLPLP